jgi:excinuclease ABC subunit A
VELGLREGKGSLIVERADGGEQRSFSEARACCGVAFPELSPQSFSFNSPLGMCHSCNGLGQREVVDPRLVIPDPSLSIRHGAIAPWAAAMARAEGWTARIVDGVSRAFDVDLDVPWDKIPKAKQKLVLYGVAGQKIAVRWGKEGSLNSGTWGMRYEGIIKNLERKFHETDSDAARELYRRYLRVQPCESCGGRRLRRESLAVFVSGKTIAEVTHMTVADAAAHVATLELSPSEKAIGEGALREVQSRLTFLLPERRRSSAPPSPSNPTRSWLR